MTAQDVGSAWRWAEGSGAAGSAGVGVLLLDVPGREVNVLTEAVLVELGRRLDEVAGRGLRGLVIASGKPGHFCAGADVDVIRAITSAEDAAAKAALGQRAFRRLAELGIPVVAAIDGACVGGGAEMAAWCTIRVASTSDRTRIGFPEVRLGIVPGFGGTQVLPRIVGLAAAIELSTTGRLLTARDAHRMRLVDAVSDPDLLLASAVRLVDRTFRSSAPRATTGHAAVPPESLHAEPRAVGPSPARRGLAPTEARVPRRPGSPRPATHPSNLPLVRDVVTFFARRQVARATSGHYPAPPEAVRLCRLALSSRLDDGLAEEARTVGRLAISPAARNLMHVHDLQRQADRGGEAPSEGALIGVLGAGVMGASIAGLAAARGYAARLRDVDAGALARGRAAAADVVTRARRRDARAKVTTARALDRLSFTLDLGGLRRAELVLEAVVERKDVKRRALAEAEAAAGPRTLLATNTSSLSVTTLASALDHPERFVGLHFFNPVPQMPLVEVVRGARTDDGSVARAVGWARALGKTPVVVADAPGFLVNRLLMPYLSEALALAQEGVAITEVDAAARAFGMPMGPFRVLDEVGLDVAQHASRTFAAAMPQRFSESALLGKLVAAGRLGKKSGRGFYEKRGRRWIAWPELGTPSKTVPRAEIQDRLFLRLADEALRCLDEKVAASARDVDLASVFGMGFPPFRGGPCKWISDAGPAVLHARLEALRARLGERFRPSRAFDALAKGERSLGYAAAAFRG